MRRDYDPLSHIPRSATIRDRLARVEREAARLRILLEVAERIEKVGAADDDSNVPATAQGVAS